MKTVIISGYFNPLHGGHLNLIEAAAALGDQLVVIVNNDHQQMMKKGKIILDENNRLRLMKAIRLVDDAFIAVDKDPTVIQSLQKAAEMYPNNELFFAQGGDRDSDKVNPEADICRELNIKVVYGVGDTTKYDSSSRINQATGEE